MGKVYLIYLIFYFYGLVRLTLLDGLQELSDNAVRVRFLASPINPSDLNQIEGTYPVKPSQFPAVGGNEGVGRVEAIGKNVVSDLKAGDLVVPATSALGCWRDFAALNAKDLIKIPKKWSNLPVEVLATINVNPPTAYRLLKDFVKLNRGDLVVQNGANSAVGRLIIQMASIMGARTLNVVRDRPDFDALAEELSKLDPEGGATVIKAEELKEAKGVGAKLGLNCVGGGAAGDMAKVMASDGVIVTYGGMSRRPLTVPTAPLIFQNLSLKGFWLTSWYKKVSPDGPERSTMLNDILQWYWDGQLKPVKSFYVDIPESDADESERILKEFIRDSCEGRGIDKGKCIIRFI